MQSANSFPVPTESRETVGIFVQIRRRIRWDQNCEQAFISEAHNHEYRNRSIGIRELHRQRAHKAARILPGIRLVYIVMDLACTVLPVGATSAQERSCLVGRLMLDC